MRIQPRTAWWRQGAGADRETRSAPFVVSEIKHSDSAVPFWALMAFTFILLIAPQSFFPGLASLRIALVTAALAATAYLFDRFVHRRPIAGLTREMGIAGCLLGWAIVTAPLSYWPGGSAVFLASFYLKTLVVFWLLSHVVNSLPRLRIVAWGLSLMAVPLAVSALVNLVSGNFLNQELLPPGEFRIQGYDAGLTRNPNDLALMLNLILPLSLALFLGTKKPAVRAALLAMICLDAIAIIATFSRAGFLTLTVTFVTYLWTLFSRRHERQWAFVALFLAFAALPLLPSGYLDRLSTITDIDADPTGSAQSRWSDTVAAAKYVVSHPIVGAGVGMDTLALNEVRGPKWKEIHNVYLQYAVDLGIPGLVLFLMLLTGSVRSARYAQRRSAQDRGGGDLFYLAEGIRVSLIAFAVAAFFYPVAYHFYFYYIAGLALAAKAISASGEEKLVTVTPDWTRGRS